MLTFSVHCDLLKGNWSRKCKHVVKYVLLSKRLSSVHFVETILLEIDSGKISMIVQSSK